jgi:hypothetical protein
MKWFIFAIIAVAILVVFGAVYGISHLMNKRKQPKYKTTAPDDDPKFLRDLAQKLKDQPDTKPDQVPNQMPDDTDGDLPAEGEDEPK